MNDNAESLKRFRVKMEHGGGRRDDYRRIRLRGTDEWCAMTFAIVPLTTCCSAVWTVGSTIMRRDRAICCCVSDTGSVSISSTTGSGAVVRGGDTGGGGGGGGGGGACLDESLKCDLDFFLSSFIGFFSTFSTTD